MKRFYVWALSLLVALMGLVLLAPVSTAGAQASTIEASHAIKKAVTGSAANGDTFAGTDTITHFTSQGSQLLANGMLSGVLKDASGNTVGTVTNQTVATPVTSAKGSCSLLTLALGATNLNMLGLNVSLDPVNLAITATQGTGSLLGNLLCSVTGLLDGGSSPGGLSELLNQILGQL